MDKTVCPCVTYRHKPDFLCDCNTCFEFFYFLQHTLDQLQQDVELMDSYTSWHPRFSTDSESDTNTVTDSDMPSAECKLCYSDTDGNDLGYCNLCIRYFGVCNHCHNDLAVNKLNIRDSCDSDF